MAIPDIYEPKTIDVLTPELKPADSLDDLQIAPWWGLQVFGGKCRSIVPVLKGHGPWSESQEATDMWRTLA